MSSQAERTERIAPRYLSVAEAARYSSLSVRTIWRLIGDGRLRPCRPDPSLRRVAIDRHELDALMQQPATA